MAIRYTSTEGVDEPLASPFDGSDGIPKTDFDENFHRFQSMVDDTGSSGFLKMQLQGGILVFLNGGNPGFFLRSLLLRKEEPDASGKEGMAKCYHHRESKGYIDFTNWMIRQRLQFSRDVSGNNTEPATATLHFPTSLHSFQYEGEFSEGSWKMYLDCFDIVRGTLLVIVTTVAAAPQFQLDNSNKVTPYEFGYGVSQPETGDAKEHRQFLSPSGKVGGEYRWLQPNGLYRVTRYHIDDAGGYHATVSEEDGNQVSNYYFNAVDYSSASQPLDTALNSRTQQGLSRVHSAGSNTKDFGVSQSSRNQQDFDVLQSSRNQQEFGGSQSSRNQQDFGATQSSRNQQDFGVSQSSRNQQDFGASQSSRNQQDFGVAQPSRNQQEFDVLQSSRNQQDFGVAQSSRNQQDFGAPQSSRNQQEFGVSQSSRNQQDFGATQSSRNQQDFGVSQSSRNQQDFGVSQSSRNQQDFGASQSSRNQQDFGVSQSSRNQQDFGASQSSRNQQDFGASQSSRNQQEFDVLQSSRNQQVFGVSQSSRNQQEFGVSQSSRNQQEFGVSQSSRNQQEFGVSQSSRNQQV
ncbi:uncharacterized protein LOC119583860 [Penaeus monodon]|uniref:uncharacterized protein LOC119583860 n=1 Tax=Penaeus monodon TaxID=6687 RepID=UPI0018A7A502|nr:uncharacterized protein LOC119583860 [Penaeus monodon]